MRKNIDIKQIEKNINNILRNKNTCLSDISLFNITYKNDKKISETIKIKEEKNVFTLISFDNNNIENNFMKKIIDLGPEYFDKKYESVKSILDIIKQAFHYNNINIINKNIIVKIYMKDNNILNVKISSIIDIKVII